MTQGFVPPPYPYDRVGQYAMVEIHDAARFHLSGVLTEVGEMPTHKVRLSVQSV